MSFKILLVATVDEAYHQLLLESQGYAVTKASAQEVPQRLQSEHYDLMMVTPEDPAQDVLPFCVRVREDNPKLRIVLIARRAEYVPANPAVDAVIREQSSPGKLLAAVKRVVEAPFEKGAAAPFPETMNDDD